jgi:predicted secreted protein
VAITLGKDVTVTTLTGVRSITVNNSAAEVDVTKFGDATRKFRKALIEQSVEVECVDAPGVNIGATFTLTHTNLGTASGVEFVVTNIARSEPIDGITTYTVSASRADAQT